VAQLCLDWPNARGHFKFNGGGKRCITHQGVSGANCPPGKQRGIHNWVESPCLWALSDEGGSPIPTETNTTLITNPNDPRLQIPEAPPTFPTTTATATAS